MDEDKETGLNREVFRAAKHWAMLLWLVVLVVGYYVMHKPFAPVFAHSVLWIIWRLSMAVILVSIAGGLGRYLLKNATLQPLSALSVQAALGLGILAMGVMAVGYLGAFYVWIAFFVLFLLAFLMRWEINGWWKQWSFLWREYLASNTVGKLLACLILMILAATLLIALAPPVQFDSLVYHLALPQRYLSDHRLSYVPQNFFWGMPQNAEMVYTWAMALGGAQTAAVVGWFVGLLTIVGLLGLITGELGHDSAWIGVASLMTGSTLAYLLSWAYVDWWVLLFGTAFLVVFLLWSKKGTGQLLGLAGVFAGFALGTKYTAGVLLLSGAIAIILRYRFDFRKLSHALLWFGLPSLLVFSPWLIKNLLATGNPIYPLGFPAGAVTQLRLDLYQGGRAWGNWLDIIFLPVRATIWGVHGRAGYNASIGPLLLGLGLAAGVRWRSRGPEERASIRLALILSFVGLFVWMIAGRFSSYLLQTRLYLAFFPGLAFLAAAGYAGLAEIVENRVRYRVVTNALICLVLGLTALEVCLNTVKTAALSYLTSHKTAREYITENMGWFEPTMDRVQNLPPGSRVLMLWEPRSFFCAPVCEPDEILDRWLRERYDGQAGAPASAEEILQKWILTGYTHLLYYKSGADFVRLDDPRYQLQDWIELERLLGATSLISNFGDAYLLFELWR